MTELRITYTLLAKEFIMINVITVNTKGINNDLHLL